jgi:hypothetical protein
LGYVGENIYILRKKILEEERRSWLMREKKWGGFLCQKEEQKYLCGLNTVTEKG